MRQTNLIKHIPPITAALEKERVVLAAVFGSGSPRLPEPDNEDCFTFSDNFLRMAFPASMPVASHTPHVTPHVAQLMMLLNTELGRQELQDKAGLNDRINFMKNYINPALKEGLIEMTVPEKPRSIHQKYRLTPMGIELKKKL